MTAATFAPLPAGSPLLPEQRRIIGLDLGQRADPSALAVLEWDIPHRHTQRPVYRVPMLRRWPLHTAYGDIAASVVKFLSGLPLVETPTLLAIDATGVGGAVVEMVRAAMIQARVRGGMVSISITAGDGFKLVEAGRWNVSKRVLVSTLAVLLEKKRLRVSPRLEDAATLVSEFQNFRVKVTAAGNDTFEAIRERAHDDLVLAVALASWTAEELYGRECHEAPPARPQPTRITAYGGGVNHGGRFN